MSKGQPLVRGSNSTRTLNQSPLTLSPTLFCSSRVVEVDEQVITITVIGVEGEGKWEGVDAAHARADEGDELLERGIDAAQRRRIPFQRVTRLVRESGH